jgi:UTP--glucose-1-phosphate uridylyltransferase
MVNMQNVKQGVIPAAGQGTRLYPLTKGQPKEMLPIADRPMIYYALLEATLAGLEHLYIVLNRRKKTLRQYLESEKWERNLLKEGKPGRIHAPRLTFVDQPSPLGSGEAIYRTKELVGNEPFALMMPDFFLFGASPALVQMTALFAQFKQDIVGVLTITASEGKGFGNVGIFQPVSVDQGAVQVQGISSKSKAPLIIKDGKKIHKTIGRCILWPHFFSYLERCRSEKGEWDDAPAFQRMCEEKTVIGKILEGAGFDAGNPTGYHAAREKFESSLKKR